LENSDVLIQEFSVFQSSWLEATCAQPRGVESSVVLFQGPWFAVLAASMGGGVDSSVVFFLGALVCGVGRSRDDVTFQCIQLIRNKRLENMCIPTAQIT